MTIKFSRLMPHSDYLVVQRDNKFYLVRQDGETEAECAQRCFSANRITPERGIIHILHAVYNDSNSVGKYRKWKSEQAARKRRIAAWEAERRQRDARGTYLQVWNAPTDQLAEAIMAENAQRNLEEAVDAMVDAMAS